MRVSWWARSSCESASDAHWPALERGIALTWRYELTESREAERRNLRQCAGSQGTGKIAQGLPFNLDCVGRRCMWGAVLLDVIGQGPEEVHVGISEVVEDHRRKGLKVRTKTSLLVEFPPCGHSVVFFAVRESAWQRPKVSPVYVLNK